MKFDLHFISEEKLTEICADIVPKGQSAVVNSDEKLFDNIVDIKTKLTLFKLGFHAKRLVTQVSLVDLRILEAHCFLSSPAASKKLCLRLL